MSYAKPPFSYDKKKNKPYLRLTNTADVRHPVEGAAGTSDACVIDLLMAGAMIGEGTSYPNLVYTLDLNEANGDEPENYVVGFRKDSDLTAAFNDFYKSAYEDGTVEKLAEKYGVQEAIVAP